MTLEPFQVGHLGSVEVVPWFRISYVPQIDDAVFARCEQQFWILIMKLDSVDCDSFLVCPGVEGDLVVEVVEPDLPQTGACHQDVAEGELRPRETVELLVLVLMRVLQHEISRLHVDHTQVSSSTGGHNIRLVWLECNIPHLKYVELSFYLLVSSSEVT